MSRKRRLEARIADLFGYSEAVLFGRARSAVSALLDSLAIPAPSFVMPSNICPSLLLTVHSGRARIFLAGVEESSGLPSDSAYVEAMRRAGKPGIVMPTHLYGFAREYPQTLQEARAEGWFVLENDTIATRARLSEEDRKAFGDALLVSFGYAKAIEAGGGGAILTDDPRLGNEMRSISAALPPLDDKAIKKEEEFMLFSRRLRAANRPMEEALLKNTPECRYGFPPSLEEPLEAALDGFRSTVEKRFARIEMWKKHLSPYAEFLPSPPIECVVPWRLIRRAPGIRDLVAAELRREGIDAGTNFPALFTSFPGLLHGQESEGAKNWENEVLNLWLTPRYDEIMIGKAAAIIGRIVSTEDQQ